MILDNTEIQQRIESPLNLLNRLKRVSNSHQNNYNQNSIPINQIPSLPPTSDQLINDLEEKLKYGSIKSKAANIMIAAMDELSLRLPEVQKPERLASIAADMGKVVASQTAKAEETNRIGQIIIYAPQLISEDRYDVIDIRNKE